jgi:hypothetical protein
MTERAVPVFKPHGSHKSESITRMLSFSIIQLANPWLALHNGSIRDAKDLADWELTIPQYECNCRRFYADWKADNPPDHSSPEAFFAWGVALHNAVNKKLSKPEFTIEEAYSIWRKTDGETTKDGGTDLP